LPATRRIRYCSPGCATVSAPLLGAKNSAFAVGRDVGAEMVGLGPVGRESFADAASSERGGGPTFGRGTGGGADESSGRPAGGRTSTPGSAGEPDGGGAVVGGAGFVAPGDSPVPADTSDESRHASRTIKAATSTTMPRAAAALSRPKRCHIRFGSPGRTSSCAGSASWLG
jgi:hypothetical protein